MGEYMRHVLKWRGIIIGAKKEDFDQIVNIKHDYKQEIKDLFVKNPIKTE